MTECDYPTWTSQACDSVRVRHDDPEELGACYRPYSGWIEINRHALEHKFMEFIGILNHEAMHKILHKLVDFNACRVYDNIWYDVDRFHTSDFIVWDDEH